MVKEDIVQAVHDRVGGLGKREATRLVETFFDIIKDTLGNGETVKIRGFGMFILHDKHERPGRNPQTGPALKISERRVVTFHASDVLREALNRQDAVRGDEEEAFADRLDGASARPPIERVAAIHGSAR